MIMFYFWFVFNNINDVHLIYVMYLFCKFCWWIIKIAPNWTTIKIEIIRYFFFPNNCWSFLCIQRFECHPNSFGQKLMHDNYARIFECFEMFKVFKIFLISVGDYVSKKLHGFFIKIYLNSTRLSQVWTTNFWQ